MLAKLKFLATVSLGLWLGATACAQEPEVAIPEISVMEKPAGKGDISFAEWLGAEKKTGSKEGTPETLSSTTTIGIPTCDFIAEPRRNDLGVYVGAGFYFMQPWWESNFAYSLLKSTFPAAPGQPTVQNVRTVDFSYGTDLTPRVFFGYVCESGLGIRVNWWHYDQIARLGLEVPFDVGSTTTVSGLGNAAGTTSTFSPVNNFNLNPGEKDTLSFRNRLVLDVWDFDVSQQFLCNDMWSLTGGAGIRYSYFAQFYEGLSFRTGLAPGRVNTRQSEARNFLNIAGPDVFLDAQRKFGNNGFSVYGNARGGYLFGRGQYTQVSASTIVNPNFALVRDEQIDRNRAGLPFFESELGLEWQGRGAGRLQPFFRVGVVAQGWFGLGSALSSSGNTNTLGNFGFFGGTFLGGFSF